MSLKFLLSTRRLTALVSYTIEFCIMRCWLIIFLIDKDHNSSHYNAVSVPLTRIHFLAFVLALLLCDADLVETVTIKSCALDPSFFVVYDDIFWFRLNLRFFSCHLNVNFSRIHVLNWMSFCVSVNIGTFQFALDDLKCPVVCSVLWWQIKHCGLNIS